MAKRAIIVHGWGDSPQSAWLPWLKKELESRGLEVIAPAMPDPERPKMDAWIRKLGEVVKEIDAETYLVGHSMGCQTILRYLESLPEGQKATGVVLVAPWMKLTDESYEDDDDREIIKPWIETPIDWTKVRPKAVKFTAILSTNDPYVALEENKKIFANNLDAEIVVEEGKGHFSGSDGVTELPSALDAIP